MKLIKPYYEIDSDLSSEQCIRMLKLIEKEGRKCYKSEDKITDISYINFIKKLIRDGHESVLEHEKITVSFICDRGISHELVRHRLSSFSMESTRYCNYSKDKFNNELTFIEPFWLSNIKEEWKDFGDYQQERIDSSQQFIDFLHLSEEYYFKLLKMGWTPEQARSVLPHAIKTDIGMTANIREWRTIFKQRTNKRAHPQMRELMIPLLNELKLKLFPLFHDINPI